MEKALSFIGHALYTFRCIMSGFYIGLATLVAIIMYKFIEEIVGIISLVSNSDTKKIEIIIKTLEIVDLVMVAQLVWVVSMAGFSLFVSNKHFENINVKKPDWLDHVNTYNLKLKLAFAMISISGVHALKTYLGGGVGADIYHLIVIGGVHFVFVLSAIGIAYAEYITKKSPDQQHTETKKSPDQQH